MKAKRNWGNRPWRVEFVPAVQELPAAVQFAVIGGGFTGLAAAAWLKRVAPEKSLVLLEAEAFGAGASGYTGGMALAESAVGDLPGLGDVLGGYQKLLHELEVEGDVTLPGVYELARTSPLPHSPIRWQDSGELRATKEVVGGTIHPGKIVNGLARAAQRSGALLFDRAAVEQVAFGETIRLQTARGALTANKVLFATNAFSLELSGLRERAESAFTMAVATEPLNEQTLQEIGLAEGKPFYTVDFPYLWGRLLGKSVIFGSGLVHFQDWRDVYGLDIANGEAAKLFQKLETRIHRLHPALDSVKITHRWGGPICITEGWKPVFALHPQCADAITLGGYSGHGVAQSVYLGAWAAEALLGQRELPNW